MTTVTAGSPRERILQAALTLLETQGVEAVSTRAVSAAADVQPPTIYRQFGDMQGLLNAVASAGFTTYLQVKVAHGGWSDPVEELREGWNRHVQFGLAHPHLYTLMYGTLKPGAEPPAALAASQMLQALLQRVAEAGRLATGVQRAVAIIHAAAMGTTLTLLASQDRDPQLAALMREAALQVILTPQAGTAPDGASTARQQVAAHAVALVALLPDLESPFSSAEQALLLEWLRRLS
ncbi:TetR/AcrR family transcriptional regulator [Deinococcus sonorensis]|uniref:TetR/AcrR family transcriptional regulator n=2 Tax=Deinococcus sonorensis TaxID=309891 RepID=A0AAU7UGX2_9DEIO